MKEVSPEKFLRQNYNPPNRPQQIGCDNKNYEKNYEKIFNKIPLLERIFNSIKIIICGMSIKF